MCKSVMRKHFSVALIGLLLLTSCTDKDLETVAESLLITSQALTALQQTAIQANNSTPQLMSDDTTRYLLQICIGINQAGLTATEITRRLNKLTPQSREQLFVVLEPILQTVSVALANPQRFEIADERTRNTVTASLLLIQTSLNAAKLVLAASR